MNSRDCREHYLNSLQPNMKKGKWTQVEELPWECMQYLIAQGHSRLGSQWCKISSMVPGRTDNAVKNFYNATSRSKALSRPESILWLYISHVRAGLAAAAAFSEALEGARQPSIEHLLQVWKAHAPAALVQHVLSSGLNLPEPPEPSGSWPGSASGEFSEPARKCGGRGRSRSPSTLSLNGRAGDDPHSPSTSVFDIGAAHHGGPGRCGAVSPSLDLSHFNVVDLSGNSGPGSGHACLDANTLLNLQHVCRNSSSELSYDTAPGTGGGGWLGGRPDSHSPELGPSSSPSPPNLVLDLTMPGSSSFGSAAAGHETGTTASLPPASSSPQLGVQQGRAGAQFSLDLRLTPVSVPASTSPRASSAHLVSWQQFQVGAAGPGHTGAHSLGGLGVQSLASPPSPQPPQSVLPPQQPAALPLHTLTPEQLRLQSQQQQITELQRQLKALQQQQLKQQLQNPASQAITAGDAEMPVPGEPVSSSHSSGNSDQPILLSKPGISVGPSWQGPALAWTAPLAAYPPGPTAPQAAVPRLAGGRFAAVAHPLAGRSTPPPPTQPALPTLLIPAWVSSPLVQQPSNAAWCVVNSAPSHPLPPAAAVAGGQPWSAASHLVFSQASQASQRLDVSTTRADSTQQGMIKTEQGEGGGWMQSGEEACALLGTGRSSDGSFTSAPGPTGANASELHAGPAGPFDMQRWLASVQLQQPAAMAGWSQTLLLQPEQQQHMLPTPPFAVSSPHGHHAPGVSTPLHMNPGSVATPQQLLPAQPCQQLSRAASDQRVEQLLAAAKQGAKVGEGVALADVLQRLGAQQLLAAEQAAAQQAGRMDLLLPDGAGQQDGAAGLGFRAAAGLNGPEVLVPAPPVQQQQQLSGGQCRRTRTVALRTALQSALPAWSKRQCTYVRRMVCGLDVSWLVGEGGVVVTGAMQAEVALHRGLLGLEEGEEVDGDWVEDPANRGRLLRHAVHTTREMEAAIAAWQLDMVPWQQAELTNPGLLPRPPRPPTPYAITPTSKCRARHVFIDTRGLYGMMRDAGMLEVLTEEGVTSLAKFRNGALPDPARPGHYIVGPKDSHVANRWDALLPDPRRQKLASPKHSFAQIVHTDGVALSVMFLRPKPAAPPADPPRMGRHMGALNPLAHLDAEWLGVDPGKTNMATVAHEERSAAGTVVSVWQRSLTAGQYYRDSGITRQAKATKKWLAEVKTQLTAVGRARADADTSSGAQPCAYLLEEHGQTRTPVQGAYDCRVSALNTAVTLALIAAGPLAGTPYNPGA
ncbi:hypothetical protein QJQ45_014227 [Haematococcus lacustris]|nr:hypothetical protein QJQ45_014227 [Haematococcus lacustris]